MSNGTQQWYEQQGGVNQSSPAEEGSIAKVKSTESDSTWNIWKFTNGQWVQEMTESGQPIVINTSQATQQYSWEGNLSPSDFTEQYGSNVTEFDSPDEFQNYQSQSAEISSQDDFGMESLTSEDYQGKSPAEMVEYIWKTKYNSTLPTSYMGGNASAQNIAKFKSEIANKLSEYAPQLGEIDTTKQRFAAEKYGGATGTIDDPSTPQDESKISFADSLAGQKAGQQMSSDLYGLSQKAYEFAPAVSTGVNMRQKIMGQKNIKTGFEKAQDTYGLSKTAAGMTYGEQIYGLEQQREKDWEKNFMTFLNQLPDPGTGS